MTCTWKAGLGEDSWPCTGDHSGEAHHFAPDGGMQLPLAETDAARTSPRSARPAGPRLSVDVKEMLADRGLARKDGTT